MINNNISHTVLSFGLWEIYGGSPANMNTEIVDLNVPCDDGTFFYFDSDEDEIIFSWKEDGVEKTSTPLLVTNTLQNLANSLDNDGLHLRYFDNDNEIAYGTNSVTVGDKILKTNATNGAGFYIISDAGKVITDFKLKYVGHIDSDGNADFKIWTNEPFANSTLVVASTDEASGSALTFFIGGEPNFAIDVTIGTMTSQALLGMTVDDFVSKFLTKEGSQSALTTIDTALDKALNEQTKLGAIEARLGYTRDNLITMNETLRLLIPTIVTPNIAKEMTNYVKSAVPVASVTIYADSGKSKCSIGISFHQIVAVLDKYFLTKISATIASTGSGGTCIEVGKSFRQPLGGFFFQ